MKKLFTTRYGSFLYGTATPASDIDIKQIVLPDLKDLVIGKKVQNVVDKTNDRAYTKNTADDIDIEYIPVQVFAKDFLGGQSYALELAFAIDGTQASQEIHNPLFKDFCLELRTKFLSSKVTALIGYSVHQASLYSQKGERLNALREAKMMYDHLIVHYGKEFKLQNLPYDEVKKLVDTLSAKYPGCIDLIEYEINSVGDFRPAIKVLEKILPFSSSLQNNQDVVVSALKRYGSRADAAAVNNVDWKATSHALRIVNEGISLLTKKKLEFPLPEDEVKYLRDVKAGLIDYDVVINLLNSRLDILKTLELAALENPQPTMDELEVWLAKWMFRFYSI